ncbi:MAG: HAD family phosphatase [Chlamydiae bacterium]|nr:HAD family phosphatase [Chlamydiota bacterium]MBI3277416.1 HAD family phosphatase [Chlamydiota bacterium]
MSGKNFEPRKFKGILFDLDGVLVDSMHLHDQAWREALRSVGVKVGMTPHPDTIQNLILDKEKRLKEMEAAHLFPEARICIEKFHQQGYRLGIVTGSFLSEVRVFLKEEVLNYFRGVVTASDVHHGERHPEPYLMGLEKLGLSSEEVIVIENAPYGIRAAKSAGLTCIALSTSLPASYLSQADLVLSNLNEVIELFFS